MHTVRAAFSKHSTRIETMNALETREKSLPFDLGHTQLLGVVCLELQLEVWSWYLNKFCQAAVCDTAES